VKEVMNLNEEEKIQVATDLAEAIYFLHGHSPVSQKMLLMFNEILFGLKEWGSSARNSFARKKVECLVFSFLRKKYFYSR
jgi:hypothetical protein